jgi:hypothetical protein
MKKGLQTRIGMQTNKERKQTELSYKQETCQVDEQHGIPTQFGMKEQIMDSIP